MSIFSKLKVEQKLKEIEKKTKIKRYVNLIFGCLLVAIAYNLFLASNNIVAGGIGGLAIIINALTNISNSLIMLVFNILLLVLSYFLLVKEKTKATIRCIPFDAPEEDGKCIFSGKPSKRRVVFARSY